MAKDERIWRLAVWLLLAQLIATIVAWVLVYNTIRDFNEQADSARGRRELMLLYVLDLRDTMKEAGIEAPPVPPELLAEEPP